MNIDQAREIIKSSETFQKILKIVLYSYRMRQYESGSEGRTGAGWRGRTREEIHRARKVALMSADCYDSYPELILRAHWVAIGNKRSRIKTFEKVERLLNGHPGLVDEIERAGIPTVIRCASQDPSFHALPGQNPEDIFYIALDVSKLEEEDVLAHTGR